MLAVPCLRYLVCSKLPTWKGLVPSSFPVGFEAEEMALEKVFLPVLQFSPVGIIPPLLHTHPSIYHPHNIIFSSHHFSFPCHTIPPLLHTHPSIYHPRCIMFFSQHFSFPQSLPFHRCSRPVFISTFLLPESQ